MKYILSCVLFYLFSLSSAFALNESDEQRVKELIRQELNLDVDRTERNRAITLEAKGSINSLLPVGTIIPYAGAGAVPDGFIECLGQSLPIEGKYHALYEIIGDYYKSQLTNGQPTEANQQPRTTFYLPDLRGRVIMGTGTGRQSTPENKPDGRESSTLLTERKLGEVFGSENHKLTTDELPSHNHTATDRGHNHPIHDPGHSHPYDTSSGMQYTGTGDKIHARKDGHKPNTGHVGTGITVQTGYAEMTIGNTGENQSHNNIQPSIVLRYLIKWKGSHHASSITPGSTQ